MSCVSECENEMIVPVMFFAARQFRAIRLGIVVRIFNLILWCENLPKHLAISRTIFIPKKSQASLPGEFRPISISSVFARVLHKILAQRIDANIEMDDQQRAFRAGMDGCRDNTVLLDALLRSRYQQFKSTFAATLDLARAFDSVEHSIIMRAAEAAGIPPLLINYLKSLYASSTTTLSGTEWSSEPIKVTRGVPGNIQPCYTSDPSFTATEMWLHLQRKDCSCHGLRGRSGSTRRLANRSTTPTRLDENLPGDLWPTL